MKKTLIALLLTIVPAVATAAPVTFNLRDPLVEGIDEVNSFSLTLDGLTATLWALPTTFNGSNLLLNQTSSAFGINVEGTTCGGAEDSATLDGGCVGESIKIAFDSDVFVNSLRVSNFGSADAGLASLAAGTYAITGTGLHSLGDTFLAAGSALTVAYTAGNGFSLDSFTASIAPATAVPEPSVLWLLALGVLGIARRRHAFNG